MKGEKEMGEEKVSHWRVDSYFLSKAGGRGENGCIGYHMYHISRHIQYAKKKKSTPKGEYIFGSR